MIAIATLFIAGVTVLVVANSRSLEQNKELGLSGKKAIVYKTPTCGCCRLFADYLERFGVSVDRRDVPDLADIKKQYGVPKDLESCHTTVIDGYTIEGHIPAEAIAKLLNEKPNIKGIALPGMPSGSPGMPGPKEPFIIYALDGSAKPNVFLEL